MSGILKNQQKQHRKINGKNEEFAQWSDMVRYPFKLIKFR